MHDFSLSELESKLDKLFWSVHTYLSLWRRWSNEDLTELAFTFVQISNLFGHQSLSGILCCLPHDITGLLSCLVADQDSKSLLPLHLWTICSIVWRNFVIFLSWIHHQNLSSLPWSAQIRDHEKTAIGLVGHLECHFSGLRMFPLLWLFDNLCRILIGFELW